MFHRFFLYSPLVSSLTWPWWVCPWLWRPDQNIEILSLFSLDGKERIPPHPISLHCLCHAYSRHCTTPDGDELQNYEWRSADGCVTPYNIDFSDLSSRLNIILHSLLLSPNRMCAVVTLFFVCCMWAQWHERVQCRFKWRLWVFMWSWVMLLIVHKLEVGWLLWEGSQYIRVKWYTC